MEDLGPPDERELEVLRRFSTSSTYPRALGITSAVGRMAGSLCTRGTRLNSREAIARGRLLRQPVTVPLKTGPLPLDLHKPGPPGISFRLDVGAVTVPLDPEDIQRMDALLDVSEVTRPDESSDVEN